MWNPRSFLPPVQEGLGTIRWIDDEIWLNMESLGEAAMTFNRMLFAAWEPYLKLWSGPFWPGGAGQAGSKAASALPLPLALFGWPVGRAAADTAGAPKPATGARRERQPAAQAAKPAATPEPALLPFAVAPVATEALAERKATASDDLLKIKGIGPKIAALLNALGITAYAQIAAWTPADIALIEDKIEFRGRVTREKWIEQARDLGAA